MKERKRKEKKWERERKKNKRKKKKRKKKKLQSVLERQCLHTTRVNENKPAQSLDKYAAKQLTTRTNTEDDYIMNIP